jgi:hypothetical protein
MAIVTRVGLTIRYTGLKIKMGLKRRKRPTKIQTEEKGAYKDQNEGIMPF